MGGAETSFVQLLDAIRNAQPNWELTLISGEDGPLVARAEELGVRVRVIPLPNNFAQFGEGSLSLSRNTLRSFGCRFAVALGTLWCGHLYARQLARVIKEIKPDLIHATGFKMQFLSAWVNISRVPVIWHMHDLISSRSVMRRLLRLCVGRCNLVIANSKFVAEDFSRFCSPHLQVVALYNAVDFRVFSPLGPVMDLDAAAGLIPPQSSVLRIGLLATFARWKGHRTFFEALAILRADLPIRAYVIGGPIYKTEGSQFHLHELRDAAAQLGLSDEILGFTGFVADPANAIRALDIVVHASTEPEPFGMVIAEGMACGKPVIVSEPCGASEIFTSGKDVLAFPRGNAEALAAQIKTLVPLELRSQLGSAARLTIEGRLQRTKLALEVVAVYENLIMAG